MQLKQRIKKIEGQMSVNNPSSEFCGCEDDEYWRALEEYYNARREGKEAIWACNYSPNLETKRCDYCQKSLSLAQIRYLECLMKQYNAKHRLNGSN